MIAIPMRVESDSVSIPMNVGSTNSTVLMNIKTVIEIVQTNPYTGEYHFTPGDEEIVVETTDKYLSENIIIDPIPSNYGHISWNGSVITVS